MKKLTAPLLSLLLLAACNKQKDADTPISGVWVETSLSLDTLDFDYNHLIDYGGTYDGITSFRTNTYTDSVLNPVFPVNHSTLYEYYFEGNKNILRFSNLLSSDISFIPYRFRLSADGTTFTIEKFYQRRQLPSTITFRKIR